MLRRREPPGAGVYYTFRQRTYSMRRIHLVTALAVAVAAGGAWWLGERPPAHTPSRQTAASPPRAATAPTGARVAAARPGRASTRHLLAEPEVVHPTLPEVLPGLAAPAADWRRFTPNELTVRPIPGVAITFVARRIVADGRHTIWTGESGSQAVTLTSSGTRDRWDAIVTIPGEFEYDIHISPAGVAVEKKDFAAEMCDAHASSSMAFAAPLALPAAPAAPVEADTTYTSDLLVLYTTAAGNAMGGAAAVENSMSARIATANTYLAQSQVDNISWHLVGVVEAPNYTETGTLTTDLSALVNPTTSLGAFAAQQRNQYGADQVLLIVNSSTDGFAGVAMTPGSYAVAVRTGSAGIDAHELAHNFGCHHDRQQENAPDNDGHYYYGYRYRDASDRDTGTIMSYASIRVPYYSNPALTYQGHILGLAAGDPKAADNARVLRENAAAIANLRPSAAAGPPTITSQPASVTVLVGQPFTLSVTATGQGLSYQWARDGMAIPAGTASIYSVNNSTTADSGAYTVTVSNASGSVQSSPATVMINPAGSSPPPPMSSGNGSGGGGGGALNPLATLAMLVLLLSATARASARR